MYECICDQNLLKVHKIGCGNDNSDPSIVLQNHELGVEGLVSIFARRHHFGNDKSAAGPGLARIDPGGIVRSTFRNESDWSWTKL